MSPNYDVQQVCENGHQITAGYNIYPDKRTKFCQECGAATLTACPGCDEPIQGAQIKVSQSWNDARVDRQRMTLEKLVFVPKYCPNCGEPYPWTERKIRAAIQTFAELDLDEEEKKTIDQDIENIAKNVPEAELSVSRIKRIWDKYGRVGYEVIIDLASNTIAKMLKDQ